MARAEIKYVVSVVDKASAKFNKMTDAALKLAGRMAALGAAAAGAALVKFSKEAITSADEIGKLSTQLGISSEALSTYKFVASQTGVEFRQFTMGIQRATRRISEAAKGTGEAKGALIELGLSAKELTKLTPDKQFEALGVALNKVEGDADKVRLAMKLFDSEGVALLRTLKAGPEVINNLKERARELGVVFNDDMTTGAAAAVDAFDELENAWLGLGAQFAKTEALTGVTGWLTELTVGTKDLLKIFDDADSAGDGVANALYAFFSGDSAVISKGIDQTRQAQTAIEELGETTATVSDDLQLVIKRTQSTFEIKALDEVKQVLQDIETPLEAYIRRLELLKFLSPELGIENHARAVKKAGEAYAAAAIKLANIDESTTDAEAAFEGIGKAAGDTVGDMVRQFSDGTANIGDLFSRMAERVIAELFEIFVMQKIVGAVAGAVSGWGSGWGSGSTPTPGRAIGGPVFSGQSYVVGERGPELFSPQGNGNIVPNGAAGASNINFTINSLDPRTAAAVIAENKNVIIGVIRESFERGATPSPLR